MILENGLLYPCRINNFESWLHGIFQTDIIVRYGQVGCMSSLSFIVLNIPFLLCFCWVYVIDLFVSVHNLFIVGDDDAIMEDFDQVIEQPKQFPLLLSLTEFLSLLLAEESAEYQYECEWEYEISVEFDVSVMGRNPKVCSDQKVQAETDVSQKQWELVVWEDRSRSHKRQVEIEPIHCFEGVLALDCAFENDKHENNHLDVGEIESHQKESFT